MNKPVVFKAELKRSFFISGLGIEVMSEDLGKGPYSLAKSWEEEASVNGWRLPTPDECFALWSVKQMGCGNIKDYFYWTGEPHQDKGERLAYIFRMDDPFLATRSKKDFYYVRLVRNIK